MLPDLSVPNHWPTMQKVPDDETDQGAIKALSSVRIAIVDYRVAEDEEDWRARHAMTAPIIDVVNGLIADAKTINDLHDAADARAEELGKENERLREELSEAKRPFTAQMTMQNRRIIALNEKILELEFKLAQAGYGEK